MAIEALVYKVTLTTAITAEIGLDHTDPVYVRNQGHYSIDSWSAYVEAISHAISVESESTSTQQDVDAATIGISGAIANLMTANELLTAAINAEVGSNRSQLIYMLVPADYTPMSWDYYTIIVQGAISIELDPSLEMDNLAPIGNGWAFLKRFLAGIFLKLPHTFLTQICNYIV